MIIYGNTVWSRRHVITVALNRSKQIRLNGFQRDGRQQSYIYSNGQ